MMLPRTSFRRQQGFSMLEVLFACAIMFIGISGLMSLFVVAAIKNAGQGDQATRTTEYAQDKMEQLLSLKYTPTSTDSTTCTVGPVNTIDNSVCTGGGGGLSDNATLGAIANYSDYVTATGISASSAGGRYLREWTIVTDTVKNVKVVTVVVKSLMVPDLPSLAPSTTLVSVKGQY